MKGKFIFVALLLILLETCAYGETFKGRVIDAVTKEPIAGAVVVATWAEEMATPTGATSRLKDVKEVLTDKNGYWEIEGAKGRYMGDATAIVSFLTGTYYTKPPEFIIFKPGYCSWPKGFDIEACSGRLKPEGDNKFTKQEIVELPVLTKKEDRLRALPNPIHKDGDTKKEFYKKQKILLRLIDEESRYLGVPEYRILEELGDES
jgi:hypothetical protein